MTDETPPIQPEATPPKPSALLAFLILIMAIVAFLAGAGRTMGSAPSGSGDFLVEKVALIAALLLFLLSLAAFVVPGIRRTGATIGFVTVACLIGFNMMIA